ncbi:hypothetical protein B7494_g5009 [Chlorociboria aeruginascens]|nr:hypothetical protein B7494_g5009 [Chlorociboria aeruginascens]
MAVRRQSHPECVSAGRVTAQLLLSFLALSSPITASIDPSQQYPLPLLPPLPSDSNPQAHSSNEHIFSLRHIFHHGTYEYPNLHKRLDVKNSESTLWIESEDGTVEEETRPLIARSAPMNIQRLKDRRPSVIEPMIAAARESGEAYILSPKAWTLDTVSGPNVTDKDTVLTFAQMAANAYVDHPNTGDWKDVLGGFNRTDDYGFGWDGDGLRGYIYANEDSSIVVIGVKGTTLAIFDGDGTTTNDKVNDNLFFSCCCGQQGNVLYRQVCDCATSTYTCNLTCLRKNLREENRYYTAARYLYSNVTALYPDSEVWLAGHSLGGSVSAMMGLTYGVPAITFEAVPDALPASRLGLPAPPGSNPNTPQKRENSGIYHFGHTGDPIFLGVCSGATASCSYAGYALESACHTGQECAYDIVGDYGYGVHITSHRIIWTITNVIKVYDKPAECKFTPECVDCPLWKSVEEHGHQPVKLLVGGDAWMKQPPHLVKQLLPLNQVRRVRLQAARLQAGLVAMMR